MLYLILLTLHNALRYLVLGTLIWWVARSWQGYLKGSSYTKQDSTIRMVVSSLSHLQLLVGAYLYMQSPVVSAFWQHADWSSIGSWFFPVYHLLFMLCAVVVLTIGAAKAKRGQTAAIQFKTQAYWGSAALILILIAIPWPFSPFVSRPWLRTF